MLADPITSRNAEVTFNPGIKLSAAEGRQMGSLDLDPRDRGVSTSTKAPLYPPGRGRNVQGAWEGQKQPTKRFKGSRSAMQALLPKTSENCTP